MKQDILSKIYFVFTHTFTRARRTDKIIVTHIVNNLSSVVTQQK